MSNQEISSRYRSEMTLKKQSSAHLHICIFAHLLISSFTHHKTFKQKRGV